VVWPRPLAAFTGVTRPASRAKIGETVRAALCERFHVIPSVGRTAANPTAPPVIPLGLESRCGGFDDGGRDPECASALLCLATPVWVGLRPATVALSCLFWIGLTVSALVRRHLLDVFGVVPLTVGAQTL
jgi:hypothetical protein